MTVWIDGWPFKVEPIGHLEIARMPDGKTVAFSGDLFKIQNDEEALRTHREAIRNIRERFNFFFEYFSEIGKR